MYEIHRFETGLFCLWYLRYVTLIMKRRPCYHFLTLKNRLTLFSVPYRGVKRPGREADHSPSSAEVKNAWNYTSDPPIHLYGVVLSWAQGLFLLPLNLYLAMDITQKYFQLHMETVDECVWTMRVVWWAHLFYNETKIYIQKQMMSVKSRNILLLFYKISIPIYAFLPAFRILKMPLL
jgi:hypothetical protein